MKEVQRVALKNLSGMHQAPDFLSGRGQLLAANNPVHGFGRSEVMADRADAAQALDNDGQLPIRPTEDKPLETAEFDDMQPRLGDLVIFVQEDRDFAVTLDARHRADGVLCVGRFCWPS